MKRRKNLKISRTIWKGDIPDNCKKCEKYSIDKSCCSRQSFCSICSREFHRYSKSHPRNCVALYIYFRRSGTKKEKTDRWNRDFPQIQVSTEFVKGVWLCSPLLQLCDEWRQSTYRDSALHTHSWKFLLWLRQTISPFLGVEEFCGCWYWWWACKEPTRNSQRSEGIFTCDKRLSVKDNFYSGNIIHENHENAVKATVLEMLRDGQYMDDTWLENEVWNR